MELFYWPTDDLDRRERHQMSTLEELWEFVNAHLDPSPRGDADIYVRELSANTAEDGTRYLVLSWVEAAE